MTSLWAFLLAIAILVGVHEYGHYKVAVALGVRVLRFSLGFGPVVYRSRMGKRVLGADQKIQGETEFVISLIPLGGYVTFLDESSDPTLDEDWSKAFHQQSLLTKSLIVLAGPMANFALAILLLWVMNGVGFESAAPVVSTSTHGTVVSQAVMPSGSTLLQAGVKGEELKRIRAYPQWEELVLNSLRSGQDLEVEFMAPKGVIPLHGDQDHGSDQTPSSLEHQPPTRRVALALSQFELPKGQAVASATSQAGTDPPPGASPAPTQRDELEQALQDNPKGVMAALGFLGPYSLPVMGKINPGGPAFKAGLKEGDQVLLINDERIVDAYDLRARIANSAKPLTQVIEPQRWTVSRAGETQLLEIEVLPEIKPQGPQGTQGSQGAPVQARIDAFVGQQAERVWYRQGLWQALMNGSWTTWDWTRRTCVSIYDLVTGQAPIAQLGGPIMLAKYAGESAQMGLAAFLSYLALVSINLGVFNLIPIPPLDGGHLMGYAWQGLRGREMSERWRQGLQKLGLFLVVLLSVFALRNDLMRLLGLAP